MVISEPLNESDSPDSPLERSQRGSSTGKPDSTSFNPVLEVNPITGLVDLNLSYNMDLVSTLEGGAPAAEDQIKPERYVWFTPQAPPNAGSGMATFFCRNFALAGDPGNALPRESFVRLAPGSYAVAGPRLFTRIGASNDNDATTFWDPSPQRILMGANTLRMIDNDGNDRYSPLLGSIRNPLGIVCGAYPPATWTDANNTAPTGIGMNVSEPLPNSATGYYDEPSYLFDTAAGVPDGYDDPDPSAHTYMFPDEPFDNRSGMPLAENNMQHTGSTLDYKAAFLQRLANPLEPYHVTENPYVTVDWATIDLTVFNGEDDRNKTGFVPGSDPFDPQDDPDNDNEDNEVRFSTRQRGGNATFASLTAPYYGPYYATTPDYQIWSPQSQEPFKTQEVPNPVTDVSSGTQLTLYFQHNLMHSLGYLNGTMGAPLAPAIVAAAPMYQGAPQQPFPWLAWDNRPFANPLELMQVPASTASRLPHEFDMYRFGLTTNDPYESEPFNMATPSSPSDLSHFRGTFRHLLNFFHTSKDAPSTDTGTNFYRLFDYVETPSPFVGAEKWYNPVATNAGGLPAATFRPPYNYLSRFQDPGRININTIFDPVPWEGLCKGYPALDPTSIGAPMYSRFLASRRGYSGSPLELNSDFPTFFAAPFRSADSADLMPNVANLRKNEPVQATLLRKDMLSSHTEALFIPDRNVVPEVLQAYQNQDRNSYFRYEGLARLSNLVGNNSNAFAVWITVGYFEVEPNPTGVDPAHPDGFRLGRELGTDSGQIKRHRAFYIIDRSVPVAFEPGQNHNVDNAVLLRRFIE